MTLDLVPVEERWDRRRVVAAQGILRDANVAGILAPADVHVSTRLGRVAGEPDEQVLLAVALLVRAVRQGSVCLDLATVPGIAPEFAWPPDASGWADAVSASTLVQAGAIRVEEDRFYLDRYWREEGLVCDEILRRVAGAPPVADDERLRAALASHFPGEGYAEQQTAAETACRSALSVITGGPGTGKTTTIARLLGALLSASDRPLRVALAAPTGKAAARMGQALATAIRRTDFPREYRDELARLRATTMHRLLGSLPGTGTRFRHHRGNPLPHDVVVIDETSMVSLSLMARLLDALRPSARLVLVGDADQLASVEAGAVLTDLVDGLGDRRPSPVARLRTGHRFGTRIGLLAEAIRTGDADAAVLALSSEDDAQVALVDVSRADEVVAGAAARLVDAAEAGDRVAAIAALDGHRLLCAHREGPFGVRSWNRQVERLLQDRAGVDWLPQWYAGQPLLVTANDYGLGLFNGDSGVVVRDGSGGTGLLAVMDDGEQRAGRPVALVRLADVETAHATTVHRSQGSQFEAVTVLLPDTDSPLLTRELLYTAVTRARHTVRVVGTEQVVRAAVARRARRATGLAPRLARSS